MTSTAKDVFAQPIWYNSAILINNKPAFYKIWWENDIKYVHQLYTENGTCRSKIEIEQLSNRNIDQMQYNSIFNAIPKTWRVLLKNPDQQPTIIPLNESIIFKLNNKTINIQNVKCKDFYLALISTVTKPPTAISKWAEIYDMHVDSWKYIFMTPFRVCTETNLQTFQYKIINRFFPCNYTLSIWYKDVSNICQYCSADIDTLLHYFVECHDVALFWSGFKRWWKRNNDFCFPLTEIDIIFGIKNENNDVIIDVLNYCIIFGKWYIYATKKSENKIFFLHFLHKLKNRLLVLETMHIMNNKLDVFTEKWSTIYDNL